MRRFTPLLVAAVLVALTLLRSAGGGDGGARGGTAALGREATGRVARVVDGDTVHVILGGRDVAVRYIGIDTPEEFKPGVPVQCFARAAAAANERLVAGRLVRLRFDREQRDRYGRLLAYVYRAGDGRFVNASLVRDGYARTLTIAPNTAHAMLFARHERAARSAGRGLWSACAR